MKECLWLEPDPHRTGIGPWFMNLTGMVLGLRVLKAQPTQTTWLKGYLFVFGPQFDDRGLDLTLNTRP